MKDNLLEKYKNLNSGTNIAIRFFDGTIIKGTVNTIKNDILSVIQVSVIFPQRNAELKFSNLDLKFNTIETLIYCVADLKESSA